MTTRQEIMERMDITEADVLCPQWMEIVSQQYDLMTRDYQRHLALRSIREILRSDIPKQ